MQYSQLNPMNNYQSMINMNPSYMQGQPRYKNPMPSYPNIPGNYNQSMMFNQIKIARKKC